MKPRIIDRPSSRRDLLLVLCAAFLLLRASASTQVKAPPAPTFERDIRPILTRSCVPCHTKSLLSNANISGGLSLDDLAAIRAGANTKQGNHAVLVPGKPAASELLLRLETTDPKLRMPKASDPLKPAQIALIRRWIAAGAPHGTATSSAPGKAPAGAEPTGLEVRIPTPLVVPADLLPAGAPKDAKLSYALQVGPVPPVTSLAYSPDGKTLAIGSYRAVFLFDLAEARVTRVLPEPSGAIQSVAWSRDGKRLAAAGGTPGSSGEVIVYEAADGFKPGSGFAGHTDVIYSVTFSPDGNMLATASQDKTVRTWSIQDRKAGLTIKSHSDVVYRVRYAPSGDRLFTCGQDRSVRQFESSTGKAVRSYEGHQNSVTALDVRKDGQVIVTSGAEPRLRWWNVGDGGTPRYSDGSSIHVNDVAFSPSGKLLAAAAADRGVRVWNGENGGLLKAFTDAPDWNYAVSISPDDRFVAGAGADGAVRIWEIQPGILRATILLSPPLGKRAAEWLAVGEQGYVTTSAGWDNKLGLQAGEAPLGARTRDLIAILKKPDQLQKALRGEKVDPPVLTPSPKTQ